jgi:hypothetical protein
MDCGCQLDPQNWNFLITPLFVARGYCLPPFGIQFIMSKTIRRNITISQEQYDALQQLAEQKE